MERPKKTRANCGTALVELAVCLPLLSLLMVASIDTCSMIYTDNTLTIAAYEGVRDGIRKEGTSDDVRQRCAGILASRRVQGASIVITPPDVSTADRGELITVTISCPCEANSVLSSGLYVGRSLQAGCTMLKE